MKRLLYHWISIGLLLWLCAATPSFAQAPPPSADQGRAVPSATSTPPENAEVVSFARLGVQEQNLRGPFDAAQLDFSLPATWDLTGAGELRLHLTTFFAGQASGGDAPSGAGARIFGGTLQVVLNAVTVETILLDQLGERTISVPIPESTLAAVQRDGRQRLSLLLDTDEQCGLQQYTSVIIRTSSQLVLPHRVVAPSTDLALLPRPIFQRSFLPDAATIVVPDQPTAGELQAAFSIAAGFGRMTGETFKLGLLPAGQLQNSTLEDQHLILVGKPGGLPLLKQVALPAPVEASTFIAAGADGDGVIQMAVSPWNAGRVVLLASGQTDQAVIKAAQAISTGAIRSGDQSNLALVAAVQSQADAPRTGVDRTFTELGYDVQKLYGQGAQYAAYRFDLPAGQVITETAYLDLSFVHTALLDYDQSGMTLSLNDEPVASIRLDDNSTRLHSTRIALPASALRAGSNLLVLRADLLPRAVCTDPRGNGLWMVIRPESSLHLPLGPAPDQTSHALDLKRYPLPFTSDPDLRRIAFVVAPSDAHSWSVAATIAFDLGRQAQSALADLAAVYGDAVPEHLRRERDLVIVGRPSALPVVNDLGQSLPAPFPAGSDLATEPNAQVQYRRANGESIGYLQLLAAPWDAERAVLAVLGSTAHGLDWAGAALIKPALRGQLSGNLAIIHGEQVASSDTRPQTEHTGKAQPAAQLEAVPETAPQPSRTILIAAGAIGVLLLAIMVALVVWWRRRHARRVAQPLDA